MLRRQPSARDDGNTAKNAAVAAARSAAGLPTRRRVVRRRVDPSSFTPYNQLPAHLKDNPHILNYYRSGYNFKRSVWSLFSLHNETGNIWTHLIGFIIFIFLTIATVCLKPVGVALTTDAVTVLKEQLQTGNSTNLYDLLHTLGAWEHRLLEMGQSSLESLESSLGQVSLGSLQELQATVVQFARGGLVELSSWEGRLREFGSDRLNQLQNMGSSTLQDLEDAAQVALSYLTETSTWPVKRWPVYVFTAGAMFCMLTSSVCHLFGCCAAHVTRIMWRFDYAGIAVLIVTSFYPAVYYGFLCYPWLRFLYLLSTTLLGVATLCVSLLPFFQQPGYQKLRAGVFIALGLWGVVPVLHGWWLHREFVEVRVALSYEVLMGVLYIFGATLYAMHIPERWKPGYFDIALHSHQLFHVAVVVAACIHYKSTLLLLRWRDRTGGCLA